MYSFNLGKLTFIYPSVPDLVDLMMCLDSNLDFKVPKPPLLYFSTNAASISERFSESVNTIIDKHSFSVSVIEFQTNEYV